MRREWIEMTQHWKKMHLSTMSPSMRREWIEIWLRGMVAQPFLSPSMRREWIEMILSLQSVPTKSVSLHAEGVD